MKEKHKKQYRIIECFSILNGHYYDVQQYTQGLFFNRWETVRLFRYSLDADLFFTNLLT